MKMISLIIILMFLSGCTTLAGMGLLRKHVELTDYNPQNFQGCTVGEYITPERTVRWWDCKDKSYVGGMVDLNGDGNPNFRYDARDVVGSSAAQIRADVEKAFSDNGVEIAPAIIDGIVKSLLPIP